jgi:hypothetical protein
MPSARSKRVAARELAHQLAVELGLAMLVVAQRGVQLVHRLGRHQRVQEGDGRGRLAGVGVEVRAREAEDDVHLVGRRQHRVGAHAARAVDQRDQQRPHLVAGQPQAGDEVRGLVAVEEERQHVGAGDVLHFRAELRARRAGAGLRVGFQRREGACQLGGAEERGDRIAGQPTAVRAVQRLGGVAVRQPVARGGELGVRVHAHDRQHAAHHGVVEGLGQLGVGPSAGERGEAVACAGAVHPLGAERVHRAGDGGGVQVHPRGRVVLRLAPLAVQEARPRAPGHRPEAFHPPLVRRQHLVRRVGGRDGRCGWGGGGRRRRLCRGLRLHLRLG